MYVDQTFPWAGVRYREARARLGEIISTEREAIAEVGRFLVKHKVPLPYLGSFPASFTTLNFTAVDHVLQRLIDFEKQSITELEADLEAVKEPQARALLERFLETKRRNLSELESMESSLAQPVEV